MTVACAWTAGCVTGSAKVKAGFGKDEQSGQVVPKGTGGDLEHMGRALTLHSLGDVARVVANIVGVVDINGTSALKPVVTVVGG